MNQSLGVGHIDPASSEDLAKIYYSSTMKGAKADNLTCGFSVPSDISSLTSTPRILTSTLLPSLSFLKKLLL